MITSLDLLKQKDICTIYFVLRIHISDINEIIKCNKGKYLKLSN